MNFYTIVEYKMTTLVQSLKAIETENAKTHATEGMMFSLVGIVVTAVVLYSLRDEERFAVLRKDFTNPVFLTLLVVIVAVYIWGMCSKNLKMNNAVQKGLLAFITAYMAHLNMSVAVFFIVCIVVFYTGSGILT